MTTGEFKRLELQDIPAVVAMVRASFEERLWPLMAYTQDGIGRYLSIPLRFPGSAPSNVALVVTDQDRPEKLIGFAEFRLLSPESSLLSYICVSPEARGRGIATALIESFLAGHPDINELQLDVFSDNTPAQSLYAKLGFTTGPSSTWITRPLPAAHGAVQLDDLALSIAAHEAYGFCRLSLGGGMTQGFGLLGDSIIRTYSATAFDDDRTLAALRAMFASSRDAFCILQTVELQLVRSAHEVVNVSERLTLKLRSSRPTRLGNE